MPINIIVRMAMRCFAALQIPTGVPICTRIHPRSSEMDLVTSILLRHASFRNFDKPTHFEESKRMKFLHHTGIVGCDFSLSRNKVIGFDNQLEYNLQFSLGLGRI